MTGLNPILQLAGGWLLMLTGHAVIVDEALPTSSKGLHSSVDELLPSLRLTATGSFL